MNDKELVSRLKTLGWEEYREEKIYDKYYRFRMQTSNGWEYFYVNRYDSDAYLCLHPRFYDWRSDFRKCWGVSIGGKNGEHILKSSNMRDFPTATGRTGDDISEYFPLTFQSADSLKKAVAVIVEKAEFISIPEVKVSVGENQNESNIEPTSSIPSVNSNSQETTPTGDPDQSARSTFQPNQPNSDQSVEMQVEGLRKTLDSELRSIEADFFNIPGQDIDAIVKRRVGQGAFRNLLEKRYGVCCCLSGLTHSRLLIASHIVPWSKSTPEQKTDPENGLLLSVVWDSLFDKGLVSFDDDGTVRYKDSLDDDTVKCLGLSRDVSLSGKYLTTERKRNLAWHRAEHEFLP